MSKMYFVGENGGEATGSFAQPFPSAAAAKEMAQRGDIIALKTGHSEDPLPGVKLTADSYPDWQMENGTTRRICTVDGIGYLMNASSEEAIASWLPAGCEFQR
jgi:hypothetical protein